MALTKVLAFALASVLGLTQGAFVDTLTKCSIKDAECQGKLVQNVLKSLAETGAPEYEIPKIEPMKIKGVHVKILDLIEFKLKEGTISGISKCVVNKFDAHIDKLHANIDMTCDRLEFVGSYKMKSASPVFKSLLGGEDIHGEGNGKLLIEKLNVKFNFPYELQKRDDDIYLIGDTKKFSFSFDVLGKVVFDADDIHLGEKESTKEVLALINENWKAIVSSFGPHFFEVGAKYIYEFIEKFFHNVPSKYYITENLESYLS